MGSCLPEFLIHLFFEGQPSGGGRIPLLAHVVDGVTIQMCRALFLLTLPCLPVQGDGAGNR